MNKLIAITFLSVIALSACKPKTNQTDAVKLIRFKFTELGRETQFKILCEKFDYFFPNGKVKEFTNGPGIDSVMNLLTNLQPAAEGTQQDVRGKIYITHVSKAVDTVCVGVKVLDYKGITYETPQALLAFIQK